jgi:hypothetical protein
MEKVKRYDRVLGLGFGVLTLALIIFVFTNESFF